MSKTEEIVKIIHFIEKCKCNDYIEEGCTVKINEDYTVDVYGYVDISVEQLTEIPIQFGKVFKFFDCSNNKLTSLKGCPRWVGGNFYCENNYLTSLKGCPKWVKDDFYCYNNNLTSLKGAPEEVGGNFYCENNPMPKSLKGIGHVNGIIYSDFFNDYLKDYNGEL